LREETGSLRDEGAASLTDACAFTNAVVEQEGNVAMGLKEDIDDAGQKLKKKKETLKKINAKRHELIEKMGRAADTPEADGPILKGVQEQFITNEAAIKALIEDIASELKTLDGMVRKYRFVDYGEWWNLWIFGWITAAIVDLFDILIDLIKKILEKLTDPDEVEKLLEEVLKNVDKIVK